MTTSFDPSAALVGTFAPDLLIAGDHPLRTRGVTIDAGQNLVRGTLLGCISASGRYVKSLAAANDGSEEPITILAEDVDASSAPKQSVAYEAGDFNANQIIFGAGHTATSVRDALAARSIYLHVAVKA